jgi:rare lipoprotein A
MSSRELAYQWTNRIRNATGVERLNRDPNSVASRGFSPLLDQLRATGEIAKGFASWYGPGFHGRRCANGERFNMNGLTAAHRTLPLGSLVKVTNSWNGKSAVVRINDRGPFARGRVIDLSRGAAQAVGMLSSGTAPVIVEVLTKQP